MIRKKLLGKQSLQPVERLLKLVRSVTESSLVVKAILEYVKREKK